MDYKVHCLIRDVVCERAVGASGAGTGLSRSGPVTVPTENGILNTYLSMYGDRTTMHSIWVASSGWVKDSKAIADPRSHRPGLALALRRFLLLGNWSIEYPLLINNILVIKHFNCPVIERVVRWLTHCLITLCVGFDLSQLGFYTRVYS